MRGRTPSGPKYVKQLSGSELAKKRLQTILETMTGSCRVQEACERLGISEPRFHQLRIQMLEAAMQSMEPGTPGRKPRQTAFSPEQLRQLEEQLTQQAIELRAAQLRTEIALIMPQVMQPPQQTEGIEEAPTKDSATTEQQSGIDSSTISNDDGVKKTNPRTAANKLANQRPKQTT